MATGWTWDYTADHIDLVRLKSLTGYWAKRPPLHRMVAAYLGFEKKSETLGEEPGAPVDAVSEHEFEQLLKQYGIPIDTATP